ncbi:MAG: hypothetical protein K0R12_561 [Gammaproteobacteria bacterium]|jgi:hypothetical protein|nr:hypothetical protein [Gammaproteobacteria bacterium]
MTNNDKRNSCKIIIEGVTESGQTFRPSDWAERVSGSLSTVRNHRLYYSPLLQPSTRQGNKCVALDPALKESNPELYQSILDFAKANHLRICQEEENEENNDTKKED